MNYSLTINRRSLKNTLYEKIESVFKDIFPRRFKRLIYISSILAIINQINNPDKNTKLINKLNEIFKIAKYPQAMMMSMYIKSVVWRKLNTNEYVSLNSKLTISSLSQSCLTETDLEDVSDYLHIRTPDWIRYGSDNLMKNDIKTLLSHLNELKTECIVA